MRGTGGRGIESRYCHSFVHFSLRAEDYPACQEQEDPSTTTITSVWTWTWDKIWMGNEYYHNGPNTLTPGVRWIGAMSDPVEIPWLDC